MSVTAEMRRVDFALGPDARLLPAVSAAITALGDDVGFDPADVRDLGAAAEAACEDTFPQLPAESPRLSVTVESFLDRLEITLAHRGESAPAIGLETFAAQAGGRGAKGPALLQSVDRVQYDSSGGIARTRLVKYLPQKAG
jgi:hypothetical protein